MRGQEAKGHSKTIFSRSLQQTNIFQMVLWPKNANSERGADLPPGPHSVQDLLFYLRLLAAMLFLLYLNSHSSLSCLQKKSHIMRHLPIHPLPPTHCPKQDKEKYDRKTWSLTPPPPQVIRTLISKGKQIIVVVLVHAQ